MSLSRSWAALRLQSQLLEPQSPAVSRQRQAVCVQGLGVGPHVIDNDRLVARHFNKEKQKTEPMSNLSFSSRIPSCASASTNVKHRMGKQHIGYSITRGGCVVLSTITGESRNSICGGTP
jgi:hypothetical protein